MKVSDTSYVSGGLMRCCLQTLMELPLDMEVSEDTILDCTYEGEGSARMILQDGVWRWNNVSKSKENQNA